MLYCLNNIDYNLINDFRKIIDNDCDLFEENMIIEDFYYSNCSAIINYQNIFGLPLNYYFGQLNSFIDMDKLIAIHSFDKIFGIQHQELRCLINYNNLKKILDKSISSMKKN